MTTVAISELPDFVERSTPASATVSRTISQIVVESANRTRRIRAWVRFAGAVGLVAAASTSGSGTWWLALPWLATITLTVLHAYRDSIAERYRDSLEKRHHRIGIPASRAAAFIGRRLLSPYSVMKPKPNTPGVFDFIGCVWGMVISGQLFSWLGLALFDVKDPDQATSAAAGGVLAAIVLVGGAQIVTNSYSWQTVEVEHDRAYRRLWTRLTFLATLIVTLALWPGAPSSHSGYATRVALDIGAAGATIFTCILGRKSVSRQIRLLYTQLSVAKKAIRRADGAKVHVAKGRATDAQMWLTAHGKADAARLLGAAVDELELVEDELKNDRQVSAGERRATSVSEIYNRRISEFVAAEFAQQDWTGVARDVDLKKSFKVDFEFIDMAVQNFVANAVVQQAKDFALDVYAVVSHDHYKTLVVQARCICNNRFDGDSLPADRGLAFLRDSIVAYKGTFDVTERAAPGQGGDHTVKLTWTTPARIREIEVVPNNDRKVS